MRQVWALVPSARSPIRPSLRVPGWDGSGACVEVAFPDGARDLLRVRWGGWEGRRAPAERTDGWLAVERFAAGGERRSSAVVQGSFLRDERGTVLAQDKIGPLIEA